MMLMPDLFSFAYVPNWYSQLDMLEEMALPEPWRFKNPIYLTKNPDTPILERYIHAIFKKQLIDYKEERIPSNAAKFFHIENEFCCFHTGLYTRRYKAIYACFDRNKNMKARIMRTAVLRKQNFFCSLKTSGSKRRSSSSQRCSGAGC